MQTRNASGTFAKEAIGDVNVLYNTCTISIVLSGGLF